MIETFNKAKRQKIVINSNQRIAGQYQDYMRNFNKLRKHEQLNRKPSKTCEQETHRKLSVSNEQTFEKLVNFICNQENEH